MSSKLQLDVRFGGTIWWMLTGWRPGVVDWGGGVLASCCRGSNCSLARSMDGHWSCRSTATSDDCKARLVRFRPCKTRYIRISGFSFSFWQKLLITDEVSDQITYLVGRRSFPIAAATLWNSLPVDVQSSPSLPVFRQRLKTFLFHKLFSDVVWHSQTTLLWT